MFYFRINRIKILSNREKGFLFFNRDRAEVKLYSFVTTENTDLPALANLNFSSSEEDRRIIIKDSVERCVSARTFVEIRHVKDNQILYFGDTGYVLYQSKTIPRDFNWILLGIESDKGGRDFGSFLEETVKGDNFKNFSRSIFPGAIKNPILEPANTAAKVLVQYITGVIAEKLKKNKDDLAGLFYISMNRVEHYPHCKRNRDNVPDLTNNMLVDYSIFGYESAVHKIVTAGN